MKAPIFPTLMTAAAASLTAAGCSEPNSSATHCVDLALSHPMIVLESDRSASSAIGRIDTTGCLRETADISLGADPALSLSGGRPFVNVRDEGVVAELDPDTALIKRSIAVFREGDAQPNPWDVAVDASGRLWVARYNLATAAVIEPDGSWAGTVDLSSLADADGAPEMEAVTVSGDRAYIAIERLRPDGERWVATGPGLIAVASTTPPFALDGSPIQLAGSNPFGRLVPDASDPSGDTVTIVTPGDFDAIDGAGGIERIRLSAKETEVIITEATLGGSPIEAVVASATEGYAIVAGPEAGTNPTSVVRFNPSTGAVTQTLAGPASSFVHSGLALNGPYIVVGDRTYGAPGLHFFNRETGERAATIVPDVLPPISIVTLD